MTENKIDVTFCTCGDHECPNHPVNQEEGCTRCIAKNLALGEIPTCFFKKVDPDYAGPGYYMKDFAELVMKARDEERGELICGS